MGQTLIKKGTQEHFIEGQRDTDMGEGSYYLYDVIVDDDGADAEEIGVYQTAGDIREAFDEIGFLNEQASDEA